MKKTILSFVAISLSFVSIQATPKVFDKVIAKTSQAWLSTKTAAAYVISSVRESNAIKMQRALEAKEAVLKMGLLLVGKNGPFSQVPMHVEDVLLKNVQAMGFDKHNALSALTLIERYYSDMVVVVNRYSSNVARWNKSDEMESVAQAVLSTLRICKDIKLYLQEHKQCLKAWEIVSSYQDLVAKYQQNNKFLGEIKGSEFLKNDIESIKLCVTKKSFRLAYPATYKQLHEYLPILECKLDLIEE